MCHSDGNDRVYWLKTSITPIINLKGQVEKYVSIHHDITSLEEDKNVMEELQFKHNAFLNSIPNLVLSINKQGNILSANKGIGGLSAIKVKGSHIYGFINPIFHELIKKNITHVFNGGKPKQFETMDFSSSGKKRYLLSQIGPSFGKEGEIVSATISTRDITNIRNIKHKLRDNDSKYRTIFKSIDVGIIVVANAKGKITEWNKGAEVAFGYTESEIIGCHLTQLIAEKYRKSSMRELLKAVGTLKTSRINGIIEMCGLKKDGEQFPVEFALSKWKCRNDVFYCAMMLDISDRKSLEKRLKTKTRDLEFFLYRSAHDLKAPFSSAEGIVDLINQENKNTNICQLTSLLDTTLQKGKSMIDNLALAAMIQDKNKMIQPINFAEMINEIVDGLSGTKNYQSIEFRMKMMVHKEFHFNLDMLRSLLQNLIQNAIKFSNPPIDGFEPIVDIEITSENDELQILVNDNGRGIAISHVDKIFDLYYRENNEESLGSGLGLYLVKNIVDDLNGKIEMTSEPTKGTCFKVLLTESIKVA